VAGKLKKFAKVKSPTVVAALAPYTALLQEMLPFVQAFADLKSVIVKGRKPSETPVVEDLTNTGICAICQGRQKLTVGKKLVAHGYRISNGHGDYLGYRHGRCFGVNHLAYELSCEANKQYIIALHTALDAKRDYLRLLHAGEVTELSFIRTSYDRKTRSYTNELVTVKQGEDRFADQLHGEIMQIEGKVRGIELTIEDQKRLIDAWQPKPLVGVEA
jgi:hypothetical protein